MRKISRQLKCDERWAIKEPYGRKGGLFVAWDQKVEMKQIEIHNFCIELRVGDQEGETGFWIILVYASTNGKERQQ